jgi:hypothetical protein
VFLDDASAACMAIGASSGAIPGLDDRKGVDAGNRVEGVCMVTNASSGAISGLDDREGVDVGNRVEEVCGGGPMTDPSRRKASSIPKSCNQTTNNSYPRRGLTVRRSQPLPVLVFQHIPQRTQELLKCLTGQNCLSSTNTGRTE